MAFTINDEDFQILYETFERLETGGVSNEDMAWIVKRELRIWWWLQRLIEDPSASLAVEIQRSRADLPVPDPSS